MCQYFFFIVRSFPLYVWTSFCLSVHQLMDIWVTSTFWLKWIILLWTLVYKFLCGYVFIYFWEIPRSRIAGWPDIFVFSLIRKYQHVFQNGCSSLHRQSCSVTQSRPSLCDPMDCSTPGFSVLHHLLELAQTCVHWIGDAIQPSHPLCDLSLII